MHATTQLSARAEQRLRQEALIWLVTVREDLTPQASPVWFLWDGETVLIYSQPGTPKLRNIGRNPTVALNFDSDGRGGDVVVLTGKAAIDPQAPPLDQVAAYVAKYRENIERMNITVANFAKAYSAAIRVTPTSVRGH